jgi:hypothetical protein
MDVVLVTITGISLVLVVTMGLVLYKLFREDRRRSEARVALLMAATSTPDATDDAVLADQAIEWTPSGSGDGEISHAGLFSPHEAPSPWRWRAAAAAVSVVAIAAIGYLASAIGGSGTSGAPAELRPLELLTLKHAQDAGGLTISGVVQNPRTAAAVSQVSAVAFAFGPDGSIVGTARAALDYTTLAPGDESPFVIKVPVSGTVSRYRVGFRGPDGSTIAHVDRRTDTTSARSSGSVPWVH